MTDRRKVSCKPPPQTAAALALPSWTHARPQRPPISTPSSPKSKKRHDESLKRLQTWIHQGPPPIAAEKSRHERRAAELTMQRMLREAGFSPSHQGSHRRTARHLRHSRFRRSQKRSAFISCTTFKAKSIPPNGPRHRGTLLSSTSPASAK